MKVKDLISLLKQYPKDLDVMVLADEFLCYYPLKKERIIQKTLFLGNTGYEMVINSERKKKNNDLIPFKWREKNWFYDDDKYKRKIKEKRKVLVIE